MNRFASLLLLVVCAASWAEILAYSNNTIVTNGRWLARRTGLMSSPWDNVTSRQILSGNRLNLGDPFGYEEFITRADQAPTRVSFRFRILGPSYLDFTFNQAVKGYDGIRLSRSPLEPSAFFRSERTERLVFSADLGLPELDSGWHEATLESSPGGLALSLDQVPVGRFQGFGFGAGGIGFRAGLRNQELPVAQVSAVTEKFVDGTEVREDFRNRRGWGIFFLASLGALALFAFGFRRRPSEERLRAIAIRGAMLAALYFAFDFLLWSKIPFPHFPPWKQQIVVPLWDYPRAFLEEGRSIAFESGFWLLGQHTRLDALPEGEEELKNSVYEDPGSLWGPKMYCGPRFQSCVSVALEDVDKVLPKAKPGYRLMYLGGSQVKGYGASALADTFFFRVHEKLNALPPRGTPVESFDFAQGGTSVKEMIGDYLRVIDKLKPDVVVMGFFDYDEGTFSDALYSDFLDRNRAAGIRTLVLIRAADPALDLPPGPSATHGMPRKIAELTLRKGAAFLDESDAFRDPSVFQRGRVFWDKLTHFTPYGQDALARWMAPELLKALEVAPPRL